MKNQLITVNSLEYGIEEAKVNDLIGNLPTIKDERGVLESQYNEIVKLDINDPETSEKARELRLKIRDNRTKGLQVWHKTTKDFFLKGGQFIDAIKNKEIAVNERMEENLQTIEKHFETVEKKRKEDLSNKRITEINLYSEFVPMGTDFAELSEEDFTKVYNGAKLQYEHKKEADRIENERLELERKQAEEQRIEKEKAEAEARELQRLENEKLKAEAQKREQEIALEREKAEKEKKAIELKAQKERQENEAKLKAEAQKRAKIEAELKAKIEAEAKAEKEKLEKIESDKKEAEKLAKAPIKKQLGNWVDLFELQSSPLKEANPIVEEIINKFESFKKWAKSEIEKL